MKRITILTFILILTTSCTSLTPNMVLTTEGAETAEVTLFRPSAFRAGAVAMYVGLDDKYFVKLKTKQYTVFEIDPGEYELQALASGSPASENKITFLPGEKACVTSKINDSTVGAMVVPLVANMVSWFLLEKTDCPDEDFFEDYKKVEKV